jgi:hypothetical protein
MIKYYNSNNEFGVNDDRIEVSISNICKKLLVIVRV